jgi:restriction system protein
MAIPDYQMLMLPILKALSDGQDHKMPDLTKRLCDLFGLTTAEREQMLPSGQQTVISNRTAWAKTYLKKAGLLFNPVRGKVRISDEGLKVLNQRPEKIDRHFLEQFPSFKEFWEKKNTSDSEAVVPAVEQKIEQNTPEEAIENAYVSLRDALADDLLDRVRGCSPKFFESIVVRLLVAMGYGGTLADAGQAIGRTGDGGIDGIIKEDMLGLDVVCVQAKRWEATVGSPVVREFSGSMDAIRARKGVIITTSNFSRDAVEFTQKSERKIVLIDGKKLAELMIDHNVGVTSVRSFSIKRADSDFFDEESE